MESFQTVREEEVRQMINDISTSSGPINIGEKIVSTTNNIFCRVSFGKRYYEEKGSATGFPQMLAELSALAGMVHIGDIFPSLSWVGELTGVNARLRKNYHEWDEFLGKAIEEHLDQNIADVNHKGTQDLVDILLDIQKKGKQDFNLDNDGIKAILLVIYNFAVILCCLQAFSSLKHKIYILLYRTILWQEQNLYPTL